jgi:hypothetical protein
MTCPASAGFFFDRIGESLIFTTALAIAVKALR